MPNAIYEAGKIAMWTHARDVEVGRGGSEGSCDRGSVGRMEFPRTRLARKLAPGEKLWGAKSEMGITEKHERESWAKGSNSGEEAQK